MKNLRRSSIFIRPVIYAGVPIALSVTSGISGSGAIDLRNNILVTNLADASITAYAISAPPVASFFSNIDNNIVYSSASALGQTPGGPPPFTDVAGMKSILGGNNNSIKALPKFVSDNDLHVAAVQDNLGIDDKGVFLPDVPSDFDGQARSTSTPDIGADEFTVATMSAGDISRGVKVQIYPNPVDEVLTISSDRKVNQISVYNVGGQLVQEVFHSNVINLARSSSGAYFVKTVTEGKAEMTKIIKK